MYLHTTFGTNFACSHVQVFAYTLTATIVMLVCPFSRIVVSGYAQVAIASLFELDVVLLSAERACLCVCALRQAVHPADA